MSKTSRGRGEKLQSMLAVVAPEARVVGSAGSVAETRTWLSANPAPDPAFLDIQLSDGSSFELLADASLTCPVIFTTAYDQYALEAFQENGIAYLLKPVTAAALRAAIAKYSHLGEYFSRGRQRTRLLVRRGQDLLPLPIGEAAYFVSVEKLVFVVTRSGKRYLYDRPLAAIEAEVDPALFFRATRTLLVSIDAVKRCSAAAKGRLLVELGPPLGEPVMIAQERAAAFRRWLGQ